MERDAAGLEDTTAQVRLRRLERHLTNGVVETTTATSIRTSVTPADLDLTQQPPDDMRFDAPPVVTPPGHHGLEGMRERATAMGGTLTVEARPEGGFEVRATIPTRASGS